MRKRRKRVYSGEALERKRAKNRAYMVGYFQRNKERILMENKKYRLAHPDKWIEYQKKYVLTYPERVKASKDVWTQSNPEKRRAWVVNNRKKSNEIKARYKKNHPDSLLKDVLRNRVIMALKSQGVRKNKRTVEMIGCSINEFKNHLQSLFAEGMNWNNRGYWGWHIDHIKPLSLFDLHDESQQRLAFHFTNMQPLWAKDNLSKKNKYAL